uniref:Uncharacterized protein n=1 Tax=Anguilla anguilla TaxID=7936 RepID=A0A0E9PDH6_ANGAN
MSEPQEWGLCHQAWRSNRFCCVSLQSACRICLTLVRSPDTHCLHSLLAR